MKICVGCKKPWPSKCKCADNANATVRAMAKGTKDKLKKNEASINTLTSCGNCGHAVHFHFPPDFSCQVRGCGCNGFAEAVARFVDGLVGYDVH